MQSNEVWREITTNSNSLLLNAEYSINVNVEFWLPHTPKIICTMQLKDIYQGTN